MKIPAIVAMAAFTAGLIQAGPADFADQYDLDLPSCKGTAALSVSTNVMSAGARYTASLVFINSSTGSTLYNPFFNDLLPLPAQLALYDADHVYIRDLWLFTGGSRRGGTPNDWAFVPTGGHAGCSKSFRLSDRLAPGTYFLQAIYYRAFITLGPPLTGTLSLDQYRAFDYAELFRSNLVEVKITKGEAPNRTSDAIRQPADELPKPSR